MLECKSGRTEETTSAFNHILAMQIIAFEKKRIISHEHLLAEQKWPSFDVFMDAEVVIDAISVECREEIERALSYPIALVVSWPCRRAIQREADDLQSISPLEPCTWSDYPLPLKYNLKLSFSSAKK